MHHITIAAIATPPGIGGVGIIRISGPASVQIAKKIAGIVPPPRQAVLRQFRDTQGTVLDQGILIYFPSPNSFTGDDVLELHAHGGPIVLDLLLQQALILGAQLARPGEFTERAYLAGKIDLTQAEAVADLISSSTSAAALASARTLQGAFSQQIYNLKDKLLALRTLVEASLDFPDEPIDLLSSENLLGQIDELNGIQQTLVQGAKQGQLLRDGITLVIAGPPNVGKSSLLNAFTGRDTAIVTPIPGTTRDLLHDSMQIDGMPVHLLDTAGIHEAVTDVVEQEGIRRAKEAISQADRVLWVFDDAADQTQQLLNPEQIVIPPIQFTLVRNKIDLTGTAPGIKHTDSRYIEIAVSAKTGLGLDVLRQHLKACVGYQDTGEGNYMARRRHLDILHQVSTHLQAARSLITSTAAYELIAEELRQAHNALGYITGELLPDELLGEIFSQFCIGK